MVAGFPILSQYDAKISASVRDESGGKWVNVGHTERVPHSHDPTFRRPISVEHVSGQRRRYRFTLYDARHDELISDEEIVGEVEVESSALVGGKPVQLPLVKHGKPVTGCSILFNSPHEPTLKAERKVEEKKGWQSASVRVSYR